MDKTIDFLKLKYSTISKLRSLHTLGHLSIFNFFFDLNWKFYAEYVKIITGNNDKSKEFLKNWHDLQKNKLKKFSLSFRLSKKNLSIHQLISSIYPKRKHCTVLILVGLKISWKRIVNEFPLSICFRWFFLEISQILFKDDLKKSKINSYPLYIF